MSASIVHHEDLALDIPLDGVRLIEASAGTGKTYTLAGIHTRLIVERRLSVREILVVTFTKAATEELRLRLRERLTLCVEVASGLHESELTPSPELIQCRRLVGSALKKESAQELQRRLRLATLELDIAQISTIHGFCQRALREHVFSATRAADGELIGSDRDLIETIAEDLWRAHSVGADQDAFAALVALVKNSREFTRLLRALLDQDGKFLPDVSADDAPMRAVLLAAREARASLVAAWQTDGLAAFASLKKHAGAGHFNGNTYPIKRIEEHLAQFEQCFAQRLMPDMKILMRYTSVALAGGIKKKSDAFPRQDFFDLLAATLDLEKVAHEARHDLGMRQLQQCVVIARQRLAAIKQASGRFSYDDLIDRLHAALHGERGTELALTLHEQYPCAMVDEFQDTDAKQFAIFDAIYRGRGTLFLIGDPKQAIYRFRGGDIHAYLRARARADSHDSLHENFRSTPAYLHALDTLYRSAGDEAFADANIRFESVSSGGNTADNDLLIDAEPATPLMFWLADEAVSNKSDATALLAQSCATHICALLERARHGAARLRDRSRAGGYRPLEPRDLAVLVSTHTEAGAMQEALAERGIPSVCISKHSIFATDEARELRVLLDALAEFDETRLRTVLSTRLFGYTLADFVALAEQPQRWSEQFAFFIELRRLASTRGVLAMLERVFERHAAAALAMQRGERRMSNWLQLADLAQANTAQVFGLRGLADWLARRIARHDDENEAEQLRLESDADRVQVLTLHKSKGLEYPVVFLPFASLRRGAKSSYPRLFSYHDDDDTAVQCLVADASVGERSEVIAAIEKSNAEDLAERLRVLYVGLTRARCACFVGVGLFGKKGDAPALQHLLCGSVDPDIAVLGQRLYQLAADASGAIAIGALLTPDVTRLSPAVATTLGHARALERPIRNDWQLQSFSRLSASGRDEAPRSGDDEHGVDAQSATAAGTSGVLRGARFGVAFHEILENVDFAAWRERIVAPPQYALVERVLRRHALIATTSGPAVDNAVRGTAQLVAATLTSPLPGAMRLCDLESGQYRAELPFHFAIADVDARRWLALLHEYGYLRARTRFALEAGHLSGLMNGILDLVFIHDARWWVVDYKTNWLGAQAQDYAPARLAQAVSEGEYDLQYLIYLVALHRWLKFRIGDHYDYERDVGGALYLFVRGLDGGGSNGIHHDRPPAALIHALDALLHAAHEAAA